MAEVLFRTETWAGAADLATIDGRTFSDGEGLWEVVRGDLVTEGEQCRISAASSTISVAKEVGFTDRDFMRVEVEVQGDNLGICLRMQSDERDYYLAYYAGTSLFIYRVIDNAATFLASGVVPGGSGLGDTFAFECSGADLTVKWNGSIRVTYSDAGPTYPTGGWGIRGVTPGEFFGEVNVYVDSTSIPEDPTTPVPTTLAPTSFPGTPAPTTAPPTTLASMELYAEPFVIVANPVLDFMAAIMAMKVVPGPTRVWTIRGFVGDIATDVLTSGCFDSDGFAYYAYKQGANVRLAKVDGYDESGSPLIWDAALATMNSSDGRAMIAWHSGILYVWVHDDTAASNVPTIYRCDPSDGSIITADAGSYWVTTDRSPSAAVEAANPGGANFGIWPGMRATETRLFLLGTNDAKTEVYLEILNRSSGAQVADITLQSETLPDEAYPRGITVDPVNEYVFLTWADYYDTGSRDEPNRASYDRDGVLRWSNTSYTTNYDFVGQIFYDLDNDRLLVGGGTDAFGQADESVTVLDPATGFRTGGSDEPNAGAVVLGIGWNPNENELLFMNSSATSTVFAYESDLTTLVDDAILNGLSRVFEQYYVYAESAPVTLPPTTPAPTSPPPSTVAPSTLPEPTFPPTPTTAVATTGVPASTGVPVTDPPTTPGPTSFVPSTPFPLTIGDEVGCSVTYEASLDQLEVRAWLHDETLDLRDQALDLDACVMVMIDEEGQRLRLTGVADPQGDQYVRFVIPQVRLYSEHLYLLEFTMVIDGGPTIGPVVKGLPVS